MSKRLITIPASMHLTQVALILYKEFIRAAPLMEDDGVVGIITSTDIARCVSEGKTDITAREAMSRRPIIIDSDEDILEAMTKMRRSSIGRLVVVNSQQKPVGIITRTDILLRILKPFEMIEERGIEEAPHS